MPGNDAVLFFSETHVVEVKEIIMSGVFLADAVGSLAGCLSSWLRPGSARASANTSSSSFSSDRQGQACLSHPLLSFYCYTPGRVKDSDFTFFEDVASRTGSTLPSPSNFQQGKASLSEPGDHLKSLFVVADNNPAEHLSQEELLWLESPATAEARALAQGRGALGPSHPALPACALQPPP